MIDPNKIKNRLLVQQQAGEFGLAVASKFDSVDEKITTVDSKVNQVANDLKEIELTPGPQGEQGIQGERGESGIDGEQGIQGLQGNPGKDGKNGIDGLDGKSGQPGKDGIDGEDGIDGSPDTAEQVRDKLQSLKDEKRLDASAIKNLPTVVNNLPIIQSFAGVSGPSGVKDIVAGDNILVTKTDSGKYTIIGLATQTNPASPDTSVQFNDGGVFGGNAGFTFDKTVTGLKLGLGHTVAGNVNFTNGDNNSVSGNYSLTSGRGNYNLGDESLVNGNNNENNGTFNLVSGQENLTGNVTRTSNIGSANIIGAGATDSHVKGFSNEIEEDCYDNFINGSDSSIGVAGGNHATGVHLYGEDLRAEGPISAGYVMGTSLKLTADGSMILGSGINFSNKLVNNEADTLYIGFKKTIPTVRVSSTALSLFNTTGGKAGIIDTSSIATSDKTYTFPNKSGIFALLDDVITDLNTSFARTMMFMGA